MNAIAYTVRLDEKVPKGYRHEHVCYVNDRMCGLVLIEGRPKLKIAVWKTDDPMVESWIMDWLAFTITQIRKELE